MLSLFIFISCDDNDNNYYSNWTANDLEYLDMNYLKKDIAVSSIEDTIYVPEVIYTNKSDSILRVEDQIFKDFKDHIFFRLQIFFLILSSKLKGLLYEQRVEAILK